MKRIDLGRGLEILANVGVLASVVFLAVEIRGNTNAIQQQEIGALEEQDQTLLLSVVDEDLSSLYVDSLFRPEELSRVDLWRLTTIFSVRASILLRTFNAYQREIVGPEEWQLRLDQVVIYWGTPFGRVWWHQARSDFAQLQDFVQAVDEALASSPILPDDEWLLELEQRVVEEFGP